MTKISMYKNMKQWLLVVYKTSKGKLIGEVFFNGCQKRGKWDRRVTFEGLDATEDIVCDYFGFDIVRDNFWKRWA